jgi:hypothetical protein
VRRGVCGADDVSATASRGSHLEQRSIRCRHRSPGAVARLPAAVMGRLLASVVLLVASNIEASSVTAAAVL